MIKRTNNTNSYSNTTSLTPTGSHNPIQLNPKNLTHHRTMGYVSSNPSNNKSYRELRGPNSPMERNVHKTDSFVYTNPSTNHKTYTTTSNIKPPLPINSASVIKQSIPNTTNVTSSNQFSNDRMSIDLSQRRSLQRIEQKTFEYDNQKHTSIDRNENPNVNLYQNNLNNAKSIGNLTCKKDSNKALIKKTDKGSTTMYKSSIVSAMSLNHKQKSQQELSENVNMLKTHEDLQRYAHDSPMNLKDSIHMATPNINNHVIKNLIASKSIPNESIDESDRRFSEDITQSNFNQTETDMGFEKLMTKKEEEICRLKVELEQIKERANLNMKIVLSKNEEINKLNDLLHDKNQRIRHLDTKVVQMGAMEEIKHSSKTDKNMVDEYKKNLEIVEVRCSELEKQNRELSGRSNNLQDIVDSNKIKFFGLDNDLKSYQTKYKNECAAFEKLKAAFDETMAQIDTQQKQSVQDKEKSSNIQQNFSQMNSSLSKLQQEHSLLIKDFNMLRDESDKKKYELESTQKEFEENKANYTKLVEDYTTVKSNYEVTVHDFEKLKKKNTYLDTGNTKNKDEISKLAGEKATLVDSLASLRHELELSRKTLLQKKDEMKKLKNDLDSEVKAKNWECTKKEVCMGEVKNLGEAKKSLTEENLQLKESLKKEKESGKKLKISFESGQKCLSVEQNTVQKLEKELTTLKSQFNKTKKEYDDLTNNYADEKNNRSRLSKEHTQLTKNFSQELENNQNLMSNFDMKSKEYSELLTEYNLIKQNAENLCQEYDNMLEKYAQLKNDWEVTDKNNTDLKQATLEIEDRLRERDNDCETKSKTVNKLQFEINSAIETNDKLVYDYDQLTNHMNDVKNEKNLLSAELSKIKMNLEQKEALITNLERTIIASNDETQNLQKVVKENRGNIEKLKNENIQYNTRCSELHAHCENIQDNLNCSEKEVEKLKSLVYETDEELTNEKKSIAECKAQFIDFKNTINKDKEIIENRSHLIKDLEVQNNEVLTKINLLTEINDKLKNEKVDLQSQLTNMTYEIKISNMSTGKIFFQFFLKKFLNYFIQLFK